MVIFYKKWKRYNEIQLTKKKMDLNIRKMTKIIHPPPTVQRQSHALEVQRFRPCNGGIELLLRCDFSSRWLERCERRVKWNSSGRTELAIHFQPGWPTTSECFSYPYTVSQVIQLRHRPRETVNNGRWLTLWPWDFYAGIEIRTLAV